MIRERIQEITDFVKSESPYRSANKGWITDDIYLQRGANKENPSNEFDQLVRVSLFWKPIIQIALTLLLVISVTTVIAFTPLAFNNGKFEKISAIFDFRSVLSQELPEVLAVTPVVIDEESAEVEEIAPVTVQAPVSVEDTNTLDKPNVSQNNAKGFSNEKPNKGLILRF